MRLTRSPHRTTFGRSPATLFVLFPAFVAAGTLPYVFVSGLLSANGSHWAFNLALLAALGVAFVAWHIGVHRERWSPASGAGFGLAGYALGLRFFIEFCLSFFGEPARSVAPEIGFGEFVATLRALSLVAFVFGFATVFAASLWERRVARLAPPWARPS